MFSKDLPRTTEQDFGIRDNPKYRAGSNHRAEASDICL
jgi:hypothetical protein